MTVSQSVKEVLQSLVDDGLVQADKIGSSNFFWSFPSQRGAMMQNRLKTVQATKSSCTKQLEDIKKDVQVARQSRTEGTSRANALDTYSALQEKIKILEKELAQYGACDPMVVESKKRALILGREATHRWTDNYSVLLSHFTRQHGVDPDEVRKHLGVGEDYEDIV